MHISGCPAIRAVGSSLRGIGYRRNITVAVSKDASRIYVLDFKENFIRVMAKADADRFMATVQADLIRGDWTDPRLSKTSLAEWSERWLVSEICFDHVTTTPRPGACSDATRQPSPAQEK